MPGKENVMSDNTYLTGTVTMRENRVTHQVRDPKTGEILYQEGTTLVDGEVVQWGHGRLRCYADGAEGARERTRRALGRD